MKNPLLLLSTALLFTAAPLALAASTVDLAVKGIITPSACTLSVPGAVDFGKISASDLTVDRNTRLPDKTLQLSVSCESDTLFSLSPIDNRAGTAASISPQVFGLGLINGSEKLGLYQMGFRSPITEAPTDMLRLRDSGLWGYLWDDDHVWSNQQIAFGGLTEDGSAILPRPQKTAAVEIWINTWIAPANTLTLTDDAPIDGLATLELKYL